MRSPSFTIAALAALAACGHAAPRADRAEPDPAPDEASAEPAPDEAAPDEAGPVPSEAITADVTPTAPAGPATIPAGAPPADGCVFTAAPGVSDPAGISILGLGEGGGGFDMPDICPAQACSAGLTIDLPKHGGWAYGVYDVIVATERGTLRCVHTARPPKPWRAPAHCAHVRELTADCVGPSEPWFGPVMISGAPAAVHLSITLDGKVLADQTFEPWYSAKRWDGWDCDRSCRSAKASATVQ